jgi:hypothetical protein
MHNLSTYIIEKLHLNKDIKTNDYYNFSPNDKCILISLEHMGGTYIYVHPICKIKDISKNQITFVKDYEQIKKDIFINSNNFIEWKSNLKNNSSIFLPISIGYELIKKLFKNYNNSDKDKDKLLNYFDKNDTFIFDNEYTIQYLKSKNSVTDYNSYINMIEENL